MLTNLKGELDAMLAYPAAWYDKQIARCERWAAGEWRTAEARQHWRDRAEHWRRRKVIDGPV